MDRAMGQECTLLYLCEAEAAGLGQGSSSGVLTARGCYLFLARNLVVTWFLLLDWECECSVPQPPSPTCSPVPVTSAPRDRTPTRVLP